MEDPRVDPSTNGNQALDYALREQYRDIANLLLQDSRVQELYNQTASTRRRR